jgi:SAM-dependent methyltransferase
MIPVFYCSICKSYLPQNIGIRVCDCGKTAINVDPSGICIETAIEKERDKQFYDQIYHSELGNEWVQGLNRTSISKRLLEYISLSYRRERFFKKHIQENNNIILDLACGVGRTYLSSYGTVVGVDLSFDALKKAVGVYDCCVQGGVSRLPYADNTFDYILSSDFFGHVREEDKDKIIQEIYRVLKPGGKTIHIIENDSKNIWFRFAHRYPVLFQKYFIEKIGGHVGLEYPTVCVERWKKQGFSVLSAKKIWGLVWPIQDYAQLFDNEYARHSTLLWLWVVITKKLGHNKFVRSVVNILLNPINSFVESVTALDHGQGLMILCQKK